jgi:hypothetical protein
VFTDLVSTTPGAWLRCPPAETPQASIVQTNEGIREMANRSYLVVTNRNTIYPNVADADFSPEQQTVAQGLYCVPILWFGLFRPGNMRSQVFHADGEDVTGIAPISDIWSALARLRTVLPDLNKMFQTHGTLDDYVALLIDAIHSTGYTYVTIESDEIACMGDPDTFYENVKESLAAIHGKLPLAVGRTKLLGISEIPAEAKFPRASCIVDGGEVSDEAIDVHSRIIGCKWLRNVPWE